LTMSHNKSIARNTAALFLMNAASALMTLVLMVVAARSLGVVGFGKYSFALGFTAFFSVLIPLGLDVILTREISRDRSRAASYLGSAVALCFASSVVALVIMASAVNILGYPADTKAAVYLLGIYTVLSALARPFKAVFQAYERMEYQAYVEFAAKVALTTAGVSVLAAGWGLTMFAAVFLLGGVIDLAASVILCRKFFTAFKPAFDTALWRSLVLESTPIFLAFLFSMVYYKADVFLLSLMKGDAVVGWYSAPYQLVSGLTIVSTSFLVAVFPVMARLHVSSRKVLEDLYSRSLKYLLAVGLPLAVGTTILAPTLISAFFGGQYANSVIALAVLIWAELFLFMNNATGTMLKCINKQRVHMLIILAAMVMNVGLNLALIPRFSYVGSAVAIVLTECFVAAAGLQYLSRLGYSPKFGYVPKLVVSSLLMGEAAYFLSSTGLIPAVAISCLFYFSLVYLFGIVGKEELKSILAGVI
jgi:O-antigen/teichoic acid export membrane protein